MALLWSLAAGAQAADQTAWARIPPGTRAAVAIVGADLDAADQLMASVDAVATYTIDRAGYRFLKKCPLWHLSKYSRARPRVSGGSI